MFININVIPKLYNKLKIFQKGRSVYYIADTGSRAHPPSHEHYLPNIINL
jgi:hypothetical protein